MSYGAVVTGTRAFLSSVVTGTASATHGTAKQTLGTKIAQIRIQEEQGNSCSWICCRWKKGRESCVG